jgi:hypothetical protein
MLDALHMCKIDMADEVLVINIGGYIGESTSREIAYAKLRGKKIRYLEAASLVSMHPELPTKMESVHESNDSVPRPHGLRPTEYAGE